MKIIIEKKENEYRMFIPSSNQSTTLNHSQLKDLLYIIKTEDFTSVFFSKNNTNDLVINFDHDQVIIKDYQHFKNDSNLRMIKKKIDQAFASNLKSKFNQKFRGLKLKILIATSVTGIIAGSFVLNKHFNDKTIETVAPTYSAENLADDDDEVKITVSSQDTNNEKTDLINETFDKYSDIFELDEKTKIVLYNQHINEIMLSSNIEQSIIDILYRYYEENMYQKKPINYNNNTEEEQLLSILKYAKIRGIEDEDILVTMLAVHQLETGHGDSEWCREYNNLGGIFITNPYTQNFEIKMYPNLDVAAIDFNNVFIRIMNRCQHEDWYSPNNTLEYNMNPIYCTEKMNPDDPEWYEVVAELKEIIRSQNLLPQLEEKLVTLSQHNYQK